MISRAFSMLTKWCECDDARDDYAKTYFEKNLSFRHQNYFDEKTLPPLYSCNSRNDSTVSEGFNISDADKQDLANAETKMFDENIKFDDYWKTDTDDDYVTINADGVMATKPQVMSSGDTMHRFAGLTATKLSERKVRRYGDAAIINGKEKFFVGDKEAAEVYYTEIWLKKNGKWLFNGWQGTMTKEIQQAMMKGQQPG